MLPTGGSSAHEGSQHSKLESLRNLPPVRATHLLAFCSGLRLAGHGIRSGRDLRRMWRPRDLRGERFREEFPRPTVAASVDARSRGRSARGCDSRDRDSVLAGLPPKGEAHTDRSWRPAPCAGPPKQPGKLQYQAIEDVEALRWPRKVSRSQTNAFFSTVGGARAARRGVFPRRWARYSKHAS